MEQNKIGIRFDNQPKVYFYTTNNLKLNVGDYVVVETVRGVELGKVVTPIKKINEQNLNIDNNNKNKDNNIPNSNKLKPILRLATKKDIEKSLANKDKVDKYLQKTKQYIKKLNLDMKLIKAELTLDCAKIIISFSSEKRVDFRELVKLLASDFKMKIELRQIGTRDEVRIMGGVGVCGRTCCCCKNSGDFEHVNIKMAKLQGLSLTPSNISGVCGRLLCCLAYENKQYAEIYDKMPLIGSIVITPEGKGEVVYNNLLNETVQVKFEDSYKEFPLNKLKINKYNKHIECENLN